MELVRVNLTKAYNQQSQSYNLRRRPWKPLVGAWVYFRTHHLSNASKKFTGKLAPTFSGPYQITRVVSPVKYALEVEVDPKERHERTTLIQHRDTTREKVTQDWARRLKNPPTPAKERKYVLEFKHWPDLLRVISQNPAPPQSSMECSPRTLKCTNAPGTAEAKK